MKKYFFFTHTILAGLSILSVAATSCKRLVEIPGNPPTQITEAQQFADSAAAMAAVAGVYTYPNNSGGGSNFTFNDGLLAVCAGLSSDEISLTSSYADQQAFYSYNISPLNYAVASLWTNPYTGIYPVNAIITQVQLSPGLSVSFKKQIVGEMKVLRALYHFDLVNLFGDVPLITSTDYNLNNKIGRTPTDSVYDQILRDLTDAQQDLQAGYPSAGKYRPNKNVATAFLAKVLLYRKEWQAAYDAANTVISSNAYSLESDLNNVFLDGSQEAIWQLPADNDYMVTEDAQEFLPYYPGATPSYILTPFLLNAFESGDQRLQNWVGSVNPYGGGPTVYYPFKYKNMYPSSNVEDFMIFRFAEQYLIRAEAAAHLGRGSDALADLNTLRARAGLGASTADPSDQAAVLNAVLHERQVEMFTEWGNRWFDLKRTGTATAVLGSEKTGFVSSDSLYPVPNAQLQLNPLLKQNPGYH